MFTGLAESFNSNIKREKVANSTLGLIFACITFGLASPTLAESVTLSRECSNKNLITLETSKYNLYSYTAEGRTYMMVSANKKITINLGRGPENLQPGQSKRYSWDTNQLRRQRGELGCGPKFTVNVQ
jgi:hypothetical protein